MTARVTTLKGSTAGQYYVHELPKYYLDSGEPRGIWMGQGAEQLGLTGEVADEDFLNLMAGANPNQPELLLGTRYTDESVRGFDVTASAPKSVSVLMAIGDAETRAAVFEAHDAAVRTMGEWIESQATTRYRVNGSEPRTFDAEGLTMATFRQHTSRALDPQLHTHVVVSNKVKSPDGRWLALDARRLKKHQRTASAHYHLALRSELTSRLGVEWQPVENGIAEMANMPQLLLEEYSTRTHDIDRRLDEKVDRFVDSMEREPTQREFWKLDREAVLDSRPTKAKDVSAADLHRRWIGQATDLDLTPDGVTNEVAHQVRAMTITNEIATGAVDTAMAAITESASPWHPAELSRHIAAAIPTDVHIPADRIVAVLEQMTDYALRHHCVDLSREPGAETQKRRDGRPITESPLDQAYTTEEILRSEGELLAWADRRTRPDQLDAAAAPQRSLVPLTQPQRQAAAALGGDAHLTLIVGPAGTGKTTAIKPAVEHLRSEGRAVFGVAPSAAAADVLAQATGIASDTVDKLLIEHSLSRAPDHRFNLPTGATLIVDEAGMVGTKNLERLAHLADERGWRVALVGDPMQFSAVGRGGMFGHLVDSYGAIELGRVHRFANNWEREASLRLRRGDDSVADLYDDHGRLHGGTRTRMKTEALDAWQEARRNGGSVVLSAPSKEVVRELNNDAQQRRVLEGEVGQSRRTAKACGYQVHVGDELVTRRNDRSLTTSSNQPVRNRDRWVVDSIHRNGDLTLVGTTGTVRLPQHYVKEHVELGYAQTSHATQGRTVDRSILYLDGPTDSRGVYVPMTRGKQSNEVYVATQPGVLVSEVLAESIRRDQVDQPAHARRAELQNQIDRPGTIDPGRLKELFERQATLTQEIANHTKALDTLPWQIQRLDNEIEDLEAKLASSVQRFGRAELTLAHHDRPFRRRGHEQAIEHARETVSTEPAIQSKVEWNIKHASVEKADLTTQLLAERRMSPQIPTMNNELVDVGKELDGDRRIRTRAIRNVPSRQLTRVLGERPTGGEPSKVWGVVAGRFDQHQAAFGIESGPSNASQPRSRGCQDSLGQVLLLRKLLTKAVEHERQALSPDLGRPGFGVDR